MKLGSRLLCVGVAFLGATTAGHALEVLSFDGLSTPEVIPGLNYGTIPDGYGGLQWNNFGVLDGAIRPANEGYHAGLVSSPNVAFNFDGNPAWISVAAGVFDLNSAFLTLGLNLNTALDIQVQGFTGVTRLYDNTYTVSSSAPTLINFNYLGVDRVVFIPSPEQQFAIDNLTVTVPEPHTRALMMVAPLLSGLGMRRKTVTADVSP